jgi:hypothetical protein
MGVGSQKGKGSEMALGTEFSARWKSGIMIQKLSNLAPIFLRIPALFIT